MPALSHLLIKSAHKTPLRHVAEMHVSPTDGITGHVRTPPLRQVLLLAERTLRDFDLRPGDLRENIIVRDFALDNLPSGTVLQIGDVRIALTFLCEPCKVIADKVNVKNIRGRRGYLGRFLTGGILRVGDAVQVTHEQADFIPDKPADRIKWLLAKLDAPITASDLMWQAGLASSYCRALPAMLKKHPEMDETKIMFGKRLK